MTPVAFLVVFCAAMSAVALGRLTVDPSRGPVDIGTALVIVGITLLAFLWAALEESWLATAGRTGVAIGGALAAVAGAAVIARYWDEAVDEPDRGLDRENSQR